MDSIVRKSKRNNIRMSPINSQLVKIRKEGEELRNEVRERTAGYILAAFGLIAGLAWNDAIKAIIEYFFPVQQNSVQAKILYAFLVTSAVVIISVYMMRIVSNKEDR